MAFVCRPGWIPNTTLVVCLLILFASTSPAQVPGAELHADNSELALIFGLGAGVHGRIPGLAYSGDSTSPTLSGLDKGVESRPVWCDFEGDGEPELAIGFGRGARGRVLVSFWRDEQVVAKRTLSLGWTRYEKKNGEIYPACGDVDGDGRDELVLGLGKAGKGWLRILDDAAANFVPLADTPQGKGWLRWTTWKAYLRGDSSARPAVGDVDGDGRDEIVVGMGPGGDGRIRILDDGDAGFRPLAATPSKDGWLRWTDWAKYLRVDGSSNPALGDVDGDGRDELVIGAGSKAKGWIMVRDDAQHGFRVFPEMQRKDGWLRALSPSSKKASRETFPALADLDGDGWDEIVVGFGPGGEAEVQVLDDASQRLRPHVQTRRRDGRLAVDARGGAGPVRPAPKALRQTTRGSRMLGIAASEGSLPYQEAFELARQVGNEFTEMAIRWDDIEPQPGQYQASYIAGADRIYSDYGLKIHLSLNPIDTNVLRLPDFLRDQPFDDPDTIQHYKDAFDFVLSQLQHSELVGISVGNEVDHYLQGDEWQQYDRFFRAVYHHIKQRRPDLPVGIKATLDGYISNRREELLALSQTTDVLLTTYFPMSPDAQGQLKVRHPSTVHDDFRELTELYPNKEVNFLEIGYPASPVLDSSESLQADFIRETFAAWDRHADQVPFMLFIHLHELSEEDAARWDDYYGFENASLLAYLKTLALRTHDGIDKLGFQALRDAVNARGWGFLD